jgi:hypothetical protein
VQKNVNKLNELGQPKLNDSQITDNQTDTSINYLTENNIKAVLFNSRGING